MLVVLNGTITINNDKQATEAQLVLLNREGEDVRIDAANDAAFLLLSGEPINEPIVMHGPFVMNTTQEINAALRDFQSGKFGTIPAP
jgi:redox-sensitive bicupin YhaK (pirin superfamily)